MRGPCLYMTSGAEWRRWRGGDEEEGSEDGSSAEDRGAVVVMVANFGWIFVVRGW
jgi:hypothetical protein